MPIDDQKLLALLAHIIESYTPWEHQQRVRARELLDGLRESAKVSEQPVGCSIPLYECVLCKGIYQDIITECDCTVGKTFKYNVLFAYRTPKRESGGWQLVDTAPKDGSDFIGLFQSPFYPQFDCSLVRWSSKFDCWCHSSHSKTFTHWMAAPVMPTNEIEDGDSK